MSTETATAPVAIATLPNSGFQVFAAKRRPELKISNPELSFGEVSKRVADEWKLMSKDVEQKVYDDQCEALKKAAKDAGIPIQRRKSSKPLKVPVEKTGFAMYQTMNGEEFEDLSFKKRSKVVGPKWTAMTDAEKKPYFEAAAAKYKTDMEEYTIALAAEAVYAAAEAAKKTEKLKRAAEARAAKSPKKAKIEGEPKPKKEKKAKAEGEKPKKAKKSKKIEAESSEDDEVKVEVAE